MTSIVKSATRNVIVFVCIGDQNLNADLLELALSSLRYRAGYKEDIVVFTDFDRALRDEEKLAFKRVRVVSTTPDPRNFRIFMDEYYNFRRHKKIIYLDFDILALKDVSTAFKFIHDNVIYFTYAPVFPWVSGAFNAGGYVQQYKDSAIIKGSRTGICSGIFGIKSNHLGDLLRTWREVLKRTPSQNDQHALNEVIVKGLFKGQPFPNEWVAYPFQVRSETDDNRTFTGMKDFIFYHFNPTNNLEKLRMMTEHMNRPVP